MNAARGRASPTQAWIVLAGLAIATLTAALIFGAATLWPAQWLGDTPQAELLRLWRAPRVLAAFFVGACLAMAGLVFQGVFRNPLAEPYLLGSASGAAVGAAVALLLPELLPAALGLPAMAFLGAWGTSWLVLLVGRLGGDWRSGRLLLAGVALAAILGALRSLLLMVFGDESTNLRAVVSWLLALLAALVWAVRRLAPGLDALGLGDEVAHSTGLDVERFSARAILLAALATALAVTWGGLIGFVGLIVPHVLRGWLGPLHGRLVPACAVAGGILLVFSDTVARAALAPSEIPVGLLTALVGGPFFIALLLRRRA
jgi:iron complex transport system permease protein